MTDRVTLRIPAVPVAQPRPRAVPRRAAGGRIAGAAMANAPKEHAVHSFKATVRGELDRVWSGGPWQGPVLVKAIFVMSRPKSMVWKSKPMPRVWHIKKPDVDNLLKAVLDALTGLAWKDDSQVQLGFCEKWIAAGDEQPHVHLELCEVGAA